MRNSAVTGGGFRLWSPRATLRAAALMAMVLGATIAAGVMPGTAQAQVPPARALFLNLDTVFTQSAVGKDIRGQLEAMLSEIAAREEKVLSGGRITEIECQLFRTGDRKKTGEIKRNAIVIADGRVV